MKNSQLRHACKNILQMMFNRDIKLCVALNFKAKRNWNVLNWNLSISPSAIQISSSEMVLGFVSKYFVILAAYSSVWNQYVLIISHRNWSFYFINVYNTACILFRLNNFTLVFNYLNYMNKILLVLICVKESHYDLHKE